MKVLLLNQTFYPDVVATAQYLTELALALRERGDEVTVVAGDRGYDDPGRRFPRREVWRGVRIYRVAATRFGKGAKWRRAADFGSFVWNCCGRLLFLPRQDAVVTLTSPPLIGGVAAWLTRLRGGRLVYWVMDLNPDAAVAAGWVGASSWSGRVLEGISRFIFRSSGKIIALDRFMAERIAAKGILMDRIEILPPWSLDEAARFDPEGRARFRSAHGLQDKFVVMHSGNHSPCHPLDTLLQAAERLAYNPGFVFCFAGGGSELKRVEAFAREKKLGNIRCLPYQPLNELGASLSAADAQVVVMGGPFAGLVHPCKIYNILAVGAPVVYIGPASGPVPEILACLGEDYPRASVRHGEAEFLGEEILRLANRTGGRPARPAAAARFSKSALLPRMLKAIGTGTAEGGR